MSGVLHEASEATLGGGSPKDIEEDIFKGRFKAVIGHPEAWSTPTGQRILMGLKRRKMLLLVLTAVLAFSR
jgi:hypothetical protein